MKLSAPTSVMFLISLVLAGAGVAAALGVIHGLPVSAFWTVTAGYAVLAIGNLARGL